MSDDLVITMNKPWRTATGGPLDGTSIGIWNDGIGGNIVIISGHFYRWSAKVNDGLTMTHLDPALCPVCNQKLRDVCDGQNPRVCTACRVTYPPLHTIGVF